MTDGVVRENAITFRALSRTDFPALIRWRHAAHVARWFPDSPKTVEEAEARYGRRIDGKSPTHMHVVEVDGQSIGYMQYYCVRDYPEYLESVREPDAAGIDFLIGEKRYVGRGLGAKLLRAYIEQIILPAEHNISKIVSSPDPENQRSIRALEKAGFVQVRTIEVEGRRERLCVLDL